MAKKNLFNEPVSQEREYQKLMAWYQKQIEKDILTILYPALPDVIMQAISSMRGDGTFKHDAWYDTIAGIILYLQTKALGTYLPIVTERLPFLFRSTANFNEIQFRLVVKANSGAPLPEKGTFQGLGVDVYGSEPWLIPQMNAWVENNVRLISNFTRDEFIELETTVRKSVIDAVRSGQSVTQLRKELESTVKKMTPDAPIQRTRIKTTTPTSGIPVLTETGKIITEPYGKLVDKYRWRSQLIAQDQILKANANLTESRLKSVGVKKYIWRTVNDNRVRPLHQDYNGEEFSWESDKKDTPPGSAVRCRCRCEAQWDDEA